MNTLNGYSKSTLTDMYALTAAGGHYPLLPSGYAYSSTAGLSHYWCRMLTCPIKHNNNDYDITLYVHSAYNNKRGFVHVRARLSTDLYVYLTQISGNLPLTAFRLYYNVDENNSAEIQLWCDCGIQWDVYNYKIISFTTRNSKETSFPGDLHAGYFSETQTLPDWEYINLTQVYTPIMKEGKSYSWYNFQQYDANDQIPSYHTSDCAVINITSYKGWQPWIRAVDRDKGSWALGVNGTSVYLGYINKTNTSNDLTACWEFRSSSSTVVPGSILPVSTNSKSLGSESYKWSNVYSNLLTTSKLVTHSGGNAVCHISGVVASPTDYIHIYAANSDSTNTTRPLILQNGYGNVGIGTAAPSEKLEVGGNIKATKFIGNVTGNVTGSSDSCTGTSEYAKALVVTSAIGDSNTPVYINASGVPIACSYDVDSVKTTASSTTTFYIAGSSSNSTTTGTLYKSANVKVQSGTAVYASGGFYESSDARLKNFGNDVNIDLDKLVKIPKKYFTWKDDKNLTLQIGTSAQAVKELYPELVGEDENGVLSVAYDKLAIIALAAVDKLYELVKSLQTNGKGN